MSVYLFMILIVVLLSLAFVSSFNNNVPKMDDIKPTVIETKVEVPQEVVQPPEEVPQEIPVKNDLNKAYDEKGENDADVPNIAFPDFGDDPESDLAQAFTYENLQESMLNTNREKVKSRGAWSRFGQRNDELLWQTQMSALKKEIEDSGMTFEQFMESSMTPIPEQFAEFWKENNLQLRGEPSLNANADVPKEARTEMASLVADATQTINTVNEKQAVVTMNEIINARKRAKSIGLVVPELTDEQKKSLTHWEQNENTSALVKTIESLNDQKKFI